MPEQDPLVTVLIPLLNEAEGIDVLVGRLSSYFCDRPCLRAEVMFIDDGSTDTSAELLRKAQHRGYNPRLLRLSRNFGSHDALRAGIQRARGEWVGFLYADLQDPPDLVARVLDVARTKEVDVVWGIRDNLPTSGFERCLSLCYARLMQRYVSTNFPDNGFDVVFFSRKVQAVLNANIEANSSLFLQVLTLGFRQATLRYEKASRTTGKSKWTLSKKVKLLVDSFVGFSFAPIRFVTVLGLLLSLGGFGFGMYLVLRELIIGDLESGWPSLISILMLGFGITNISVGIIAEYLWRTLDAARRRPVFIVDTAEDLPNSEPGSLDTDATKP